MARFFIDHPVFAWVIAILITLAGILSISRLPIEAYPDIAPPQVQVIGQLSRRRRRSGGTYRHAGHRAAAGRH
ncbi:MAG: efflux RND transporter permease subunit [Steroidobacteraceae bacterium]